MWGGRSLEARDVMDSNGARGSFTSELPLGEKMSIPLDDTYSERSGKRLEESARDTRSGPAIRDGMCYYVTLSYVFACCLLVLGCLPTLGIDFELSGESIFENFKLDGSKFKSFTNGFTVQKSGALWKIVRSPAGLLTTENVMFDGVDVYILSRNLKIESHDIARFPQDILMFTNGITYTKTATAMIFTGDYPHGALDISRLVWFAFLSGPTLRRPGVTSLPAPWGASFRPESSSFNLRVEWPELDSPFPAKVEFIASDQEWTNSVRKLQLSQVVTNPPAYDNGYVAGIYRVLQWTNLDQNGATARFPVEFELVRFYPSKFKAKGPAERYLGRVTEFKKARPLIGPLEIKEDLDVLDYRFRDAALPWLYIVYTITNRSWKTTNDPLVTQEIGYWKTNYVRALSLPVHKPSGRQAGDPHRRLIVLVCVVLAGLSWPVAWLLARNRKIGPKSRDNRRVYYEKDE